MTWKEGDNMANITLRNVDERVFRRFKAVAVRRGLTVGKAVTQALAKWVSRQKAVKKASIFDIKPVDFGKGTENLSREIDKVLYG